MFNKEQLVKISNIIDKASTTLRKAYLGKRYFKSIEERLNKAQVETVDHITPKQIELSDKEYQELLGMYERGKGHEDTACARIGNKFTVLYFDVETERNPLHILAGHPLSFEVKQELITSLWGYLYRYLNMTDKRDRLSIGFDHIVLPKLLAEEGEITEIYLQKADEERFFELLCDNVMGTERETVLKVQGLKYDMDFGRKIA